MNTGEWRGLQRGIHLQGCVGTRLVKESHCRYMYPAMQMKQTGHCHQRAREEKFVVFEEDPGGLNVASSWNVDVGSRSVRQPGAWEIPEVWKETEWE